MEFNTGNFTFSSAFFEDIVRSIPSGLHIYEFCEPDKLYLIFGNPAAEKLTGIPNNTIIGKELSAIFPNSLENGIVETHIQVMKTGKSSLLENYHYSDSKIAGVFSIRLFRLSSRYLASVFENVTSTILTQEALEKHIIAMTRPVETETVEFETLFNIEDIQKLQNHFSAATGVASIITRPDGTPITKPSNFCRLCNNIIRNTEKGKQNCYYSYSVIANYNTSGPIIQHCLNGGLWDAGASITVGGKHIANWLIGQVRDETQSEEKMREYARNIGADEESFMAAFWEVPRMSFERFKLISEMLFTLASQLSQTAYQNMVQARFISERKKAEDALKLSEKRYKTYVKNAPEGIFVADETGHYIEVNPAACQITGYSEHELLNMNLIDLIPECARQKAGNHFQRTVTHGYAQGEGLFIHKSGELRTWVVTAVKLSDTRFLGFTVDITDLKKALEDKHQIELQLQKTQKIESLGILAGGIAHDFNNLLGGIFGNIELAQRTDSKEQSDMFLEKAIKIMEQARNLAHQLLTFSKGGDPRKATGNVSTLLYETSAFSLSGTKIKHTMNIQSDLWLADFDKNQISQVINNLIINAVQAMPDGGKIDISAQNTELFTGGHPLLKPGKYIQITVSDSGPGIDKDVLPRIFDPFFTTKSKGSGLGLTTSFSILKKHYGIIDVESSADKGTLFHVFLPASECQRLQPDPNQTQKPKKHTGSGKILIMDDEKFVVQILRDILKTLGYTCITASDGNEALEIFMQHINSESSLKAIILDLTVPGGMSGIDTVKKIREIDTKIPVFVSSGYSDAPVVSDPEKYGFSDSIPKPFMICEISSVLEKHFPSE